MMRDVMTKSLNKIITKVWGISQDITYTTQSETYVFMWKMTHHYSRLSFADPFHVYMANIGQSVDSCILQIENDREQLETRDMRYA